MIDPVSNAARLFLYCWEAFPTSFQYLVYLAVGLFAIVSIVHQVFR